MGKGALSPVRDAHDRGRKKKDRIKRAAAVRGAARKAAKKR